MFENNRSDAIINTYFVLFVKTWNVDNVKRYFDVIGFAFNKEKHNVEI